MGLVLIDGFEDLSSWALVTAPTTVPGRNGNAMSATANASTIFTIPTAHEGDCVTVGFAFRISSSSTGPIATLTSDNGVTLHNQLRISAGAALEISRSTSNQVAVSGPGIISVDNWCYIEWSIRLHDTLGTTVVRVNGVPVITATNLDTRNAGTKTTYDRFTLTNGIGGTALYDDVYVCTATTTPDAFLGDIAVETLYPNANGNANQWVGSDSDSTDNYLLVDESQASTTDYVGSVTSGHQDLYNLTPLVRTSGTIVGVCHQAYAAKADSGARQLRVVNRGAADTKTAPFDLTGTYAPYHYVLTTDPEGTAEQRPTVGTGTANVSNATNITIGCRFTFVQAGRITKIRYHRGSAMSGTVNLGIWNSIGTRVVGPIADSQGAGTDGYQTVTLPTPVVVAAGSTYTLGLDAPTTTFHTPTESSTGTTDVTVVDTTLSNSAAGSMPISVNSACVYLEPVYEPGSGSAWTIANVNNLQSGVEVA